MTSNTHRSSGYDLKQLFIGAEGTLGVVTGVSILTPPAPQAVNNVILALPTFEDVAPLFKLARRCLSEILSAFEFIDRTAYELAVKHGQGKGLSDEEVEGAQCFVLLETSGGENDHDEEVRIPSTDAGALINVSDQRNSICSLKLFWTLMMRGP
jgi:FAD/FMN-containing dehydrogenase